MVIKLADNILSPLGGTSRSNFLAVREGCCGLRLYDHPFGLPEAAMLSLLDRNNIPSAGNYTFFERIAILSAAAAIGESGIDPASPRTVFILSSTKGNVDALGVDGAAREQDYPLPVSAARIAAHFGNRATPVTVSNACTSGVCALITAMRLLENHIYDNAVVIGADVQSAFIVSGFQSFKALSTDRCRPFDRDRCGLNLGEAAATMVLTAAEGPAPGQWQLMNGAINNDANHISGPSRTGEGSLRALQKALAGFDTAQLAFINAHGTATPYNDEMEAIALHRAGLDAIPTGSLKPHFGHTMGAAGVLETIISMQALDNHCILPTLGYENCGVSHNINILRQSQHTDKGAFLKMLSGFGGCNAALLCQKRKEDKI